jgi:hypothetical protein
MPLFRSVRQILTDILLPLFDTLLIIGGYTNMLATGQENISLMPDTVIVNTLNGTINLNNDNSNNIAADLSSASANFTTITEPVSPIADWTCPNSIDVDPGSRAYNSMHIKCIEETIKICKPSALDLLYGLGSMRLSIQGQEDNLCVIGIVHEIEMGEDRYLCSVPLDKLLNWASWKKGKGTEALEDILAFCKPLE